MSHRCVVNAAWLVRNTGFIDLEHILIIEVMKIRTIKTFAKVDYHLNNFLNNYWITTPNSITDINGLFAIC